MNHSEQQGRTGLLFYLFAAVLVYGILFLGVPIGQAALPDRRYRDAFLLATGVLGLAGGFTWGGINKVRPESRRFEDRVLMWAAVCLPAYVLLQWIPLPTGLVSFLSPSRGELLRALEPLFGRRSFASLSIKPAATFGHFLLICAYCVLFFAAREFSVRARRKVWIVALPVLAGGALEAALGILQFTSGSDSPLRGTFEIRNHLAGLLEMAFPLAAAYSLSAIGGGRGREERNERNWLLVAGGFVLAGCLLAVGLLTLSRGGFAGTLASLLVIGVFAVGRGTPLWQRTLMVALLGGLLAMLLFFVTPLSLVTRLAEHTTEGRTALWSEGVNVVREFPLFGAGMGGFESAFLKFKATEGQFVVDYAHNDYLQGFAELGFAGFVLVAGLLGAAVVRCGRMARGDLRDTSSGARETRWAGLGCLASLAAILVHSTVDFNLYVSANAATLAWICGMAAGLTPSQRMRRRSVEVAENLRPDPVLPV